MKYIYICIFILLNFNFLSAQIVHSNKLVRYGFGFISTEKTGVFKENSDEFKKGPVPTLSFMVGKLNRQGGTDNFNLQISFGIWSNFNVRSRDMNSLIIDTRSVNPVDAVYFRAGLGYSKSFNLHSWASGLQIDIGPYLFADYTHKNIHPILLSGIPAREESIRLNLGCAPELNFFIPNSRCVLSFMVFIDLINGEHMNTGINNALSPPVTTVPIDTFSANFFPQNNIRTQLSFGYFLR